MVQWLHERYISRVEHQEIVAYYRKLVAQMHGKVRDLRTQLDAQTLDRIFMEPGPDIGPKPDARPAEKAPSVPPPGGEGSNVIKFDFRPTS